MPFSAQQGLVEHADEMRAHDDAAIGALELTQDQVVGPQPGPDLLDIREDSLVYEEWQRCR